jgi:hypothetical protein
MRFPIRRWIEMNETRKTTMSETKPEFLLLFRGEDWDKGLSPEQLQKMLTRVTAWYDGLQNRGIVKAAQALAREGRVIKGRGISDGPFAETKEGVGGALLVQTQDIEEAVALAKSCPTLDYGVSIEVRPVLDECPIFKRAREQMLVGAA